MPSRLGYGLYKKIDRLKNIFRCIYIIILIFVLCRPERPKLTTLGYSVNIKDLWTCMIRGFKFVLPFQSSKFIHKRFP